MAGIDPNAAVVEPVVLSASRATDIPAFYADWFMNRLRAGFFPWTNPFRPSQVQRVSTARVRAIVFWSKHPAGKRASWIPGRADGKPCLKNHANHANRVKSVVGACGGW